MPAYVLKIKRLSKTKTVTIFRRNHLDIEGFVRTENGWFFEEEFTHYGTVCKFSMHVKSDDICSMYSIDQKTTKVQGSKHDFGVFIRAGKMNPPFTIHRTVDNVEFLLECSGKSLAYDNGQGIARTKEKSLARSCPTISGKKYPVEIPETVTWNMTHPLQGGKVSPK